MKLFLVDTNARVVESWKAAFGAFPEVTILCENILAVAQNTIVSPANSYGFMDGGIDAAYLQYFGPGMQAALQDAIARRLENLLPVGASILIRTGNARIPYLISAPTMQGPERVESMNCYRAMAAMLRSARQHAEVVTDVYCPGLATGTGGVPPDDAAREMASAYRDALSKVNP
jgi:O-acetyl-ADP-ribose deacetylase (regulator of RNase III)